MEALDRRFEGAVRMPVDLLVQLSNAADGGSELYDADAVNLGPEGLGLRSAILPDIGQRLRCRFELPDDGGTCETDAHVVWASDTGTVAGEFGVKFDALEPRVQAVVDRWVSTIEGGVPRVITPVSTASPIVHEQRRIARGKSAFIHLDGVGSPIEGMVTSEDAHRIAIAQPLPFLALGKGATLEVGGDTDRRALSHVELQIENGVPRLVLTLEKMAARATTKSAPPELRSPDATITEDDVIAPPVIAKPAVIAKATPQSEWVTSEEPETPAPSSMDEEPIRASRDLDRMREREPVRVVREEASEDDEESPPSVSLKERVTPQLVKLVASMRAAWAITIATTGPWSARAASWLVQTAKTVATYVRENAPERLGALFGRAPRRRTTAPPPVAAPLALRREGHKADALRRARATEPPAAPVSPLRGKGRLALAGMMAVVAVGLTAYALSTPAAAEETPALVAPPVIAAPVIADPAPIVEETAIESGAEIPAAPVVEAAPAPAPVVGGHLPAPTFPTLGSAPAAAETAEEEAPAPIASAPSSAFGADEVANGRTSTLRMSQPITSLVGQADESGFTVTVDGALSLDRAGPIAAANPSVERASVLNRGDHCVLTVRFVAGRTPAYRVAIRGQAIEVTIGR
jgi:hypothetical protein